MRFGVITVSDKASRGQRADLGGPAAQALLEAAGHLMADYRVVADEREQIASAILGMADQQELELIVTTGGTGLSPRDVTPQATLSVLEYQVPGLAEAMRQEGLKHTPAALLSRAVAGVRGRSLVVNLPGSPKGVRESLAAILPALPHAVETLRGQVGEHERPH